MHNATTPPIVPPTIAPIWKLPGPTDEGLDRMLEVDDVGMSGAEAAWEKVDEDGEYVLFDELRRQHKHKHIF